MSICLSESDAHWKKSYVFFGIILFLVDGELVHFFGLYFKAFGCGVVSCDGDSVPVCKVTVCHSFHSQV